MRCVRGISTFERTAQIKPSTKKSTHELRHESTSDFLAHRNYAAASVITYIS